MIYPILFVGALLLLPVMVIVLKLFKAFLKFQSSKAPFIASKMYHYPGPFPLLSLFRPNSLKDYLQAMVDKEGNLKHKVVFMGPHFDGSPLIFINDANYFKEATTEEKCPKLEFFYDSFKIVLGEGLVTSSGAVWKRQRRLLTPIFHFQNLKQMPDIMTRNVIKFTKELEDLKGKEVRAISIYAELTLAIIIDCVFGGEEILSFHTLSKLWETANIALNGYFLSALLLGKKFNSMLSFVPYNRNITHAMKEIRRNITEAIKKKRQQIAAGNYSKDLLTELLTVTDKETGQPIPDELIGDECLTFLFAGHDTTSSLLSFVSLILTEREDVVAKLREEIDTVLGDREVPEYEDVSKFHYCRMVLHETLRMCPPVPSLHRRVAESFTIEGFEVPAGSCFNFNPITAHYDNRYWKDPFTFRPERWDTSNRGEEAERHPYAFIPFSAGARNCIGQKFSLIEGTLALVMIVRKFDIVSSQKYDDITWDFEGTLKPINCRVCWMGKKAVFGKFFHTPSFTEDASFLENTLICIDENGIIERIIKKEENDNFDEIKAEYAALNQLINFNTEHHWILPGMIDTHIHAGQFDNIGRALHLPLEKWLFEYTFPLESSFSDINLARERYNTLVENLLAQGTTTAVYFATIHEEATVELAKICLEKKQRAFVGKVCMDNPDQCPDYYIEKTSECVTSMENVINKIHKMADEHKNMDQKSFPCHITWNESRRVRPIITPRFIPSCTNELLQKLSELADKYPDVLIQSHSSESNWVMEYCSNRFDGKTDTEVYNEFGLLRKNSLWAHSIFLSPSDVALFIEKKASISHCPLSNFYFGNACFPARHFYDCGLTQIGLGTDISGGYSNSMLDSCRNAVIASLALENGVDPTNKNRKYAHPAKLSITQSFYLATVGGAAALGIDHFVGTFEVGKSFDAMLIVSPFSIQSCSNSNHQELFERILYHTNESRIKVVWVQGDIVSIKPVR